MTKENNENQLESVSLTDELTAVLEEIVEDSTEEHKEEKVSEPYEVINESEFMLHSRHYRLVANHREGFDPEKLVERYSEVLARYDYVVGDWGYEQLRLKGFFATSNKRALPDQRIDTLQDYLYEYCNFGCAYFVIERIGGKKEKTHTKKTHKQRTQTNHQKTKNQAHIAEKREVINEKKHKPKVKPKIKTRKVETPKTELRKNEPRKTPTAKQPTKKEFTIRKRNEEE